MKIWEKGLSQPVTWNRCLSPISSITNMSYKIPYNRNKNSILLCQIHCALKKIYLKATYCSEHTALPANPGSGVIIGDEAILLWSTLLSCVCGWVWECERVLCVCVHYVCLGSDCVPNRILLLAPRAVVTLLTLWGCTGSRHTRKTHSIARTYTHKHKHRVLSFPGSSTAGSNEGPIGGIQRTPHNCLTEKPKLLMGTTLIFPFLKEAFFPPLSLISKCLVFQTAGGESECLYASASLMDCLDKSIFNRQQMI